MSLNRKTILSVILLTIETSAFAAHLVPATSSGFAYTGRTSHTYKPGAVAWTYPGVQIRCTFSGTSVQMKTNPDCGYFMVEIDSMAPHKVQVMKGSNITLLGKDLPEGEHSLTLTYLIEGHAKKPTFYGLLLDDGCDLGERPVLPERRIEFIGNSITCGYGNEGLNKNDHFDYATENHYYSYASITARNLEAQHWVVARSGIGAYRNYGEPKTGSPGSCMPVQYEYTGYAWNPDFRNQPTLLGEKWDFSRYQPDVICINLGTNDLSTNNYDLQLLRLGYQKLLKMAREHNPKAKIVFLTGSMLYNQELQEAKQLLDEIAAEARKSGDKEVYRFDIAPISGEEFYGNDWHPNIYQDEKMASELTAYLRQLMGWY